MADSSQPELEQARRELRRSDAWGACAELARDPNILDRFAAELADAGVVGEQRNLKLIYLAVTSRLLPRPISIVVKGPSSAGKSHIVERVLEYFPDDAYYACTAMSEKALVYGTEPLSHRFLVIYEAAGMQGEFVTYAIRSLLSEGHLRYETVESTETGIQPRVIERKGPTGLIVTTTAVSLHPENETRLLSLTVTDTPEQTKAILQAIAADRSRGRDLESWHALQEWLAAGDAEAAVPYAQVLADLVPPIGTRLRRDFTALLTLIKAHALLHQATRDRDSDGRIIATVDDYAAVRELVADLLEDGLEAAVSPMRETVEAVARLNAADGVSLQRLREELGGLDKSSASRRAKAAVNRGYLRNLEDRKGRPARYVLGEPLPADVQLLPLPEEVAHPLKGNRCAVAPESQRDANDGPLQARPPTSEPTRSSGYWIVTRTSPREGRCEHLHNVRARLRQHQRLRRPPRREPRAPVQQRAPRRPPLPRSGGAPRARLDAGRARPMAPAARLAALAPVSGSRNDGEARGEQAERFGSPSARHDLYASA